MQEIQRDEYNEQRIQGQSQKYVEMWTYERKEVTDQWIGFEIVS